MTRLLRRAVGAALVTALALTACTGGGSADDATERSTTSAAERTSTTDAPNRTETSGATSTTTEPAGADPHNGQGGPGPDDGHGPDDAAEEVPVDPEEVRTVDALWAMTAAEIREGDEEATRVGCPPKGSTHRVWGTDTYTDDSSVCTAAVHRGLLTYEDGGEVLIEHRPGMPSYLGSTRNGVSTREWESWSGSFVFIGARGVAIEGDGEP